MRLEEQWLIQAIDYYNLVPFGFSTTVMRIEENGVKKTIFQKNYI
ncbi:hypothetical protein [uncultured Flavobacterium sp.]